MSSMAGTKRTGLATGLVSLRLNGHTPHVPGEALYALSLEVAHNEADVGGTPDQVPS